ncbi:unknown [[Mannheimia] succiniciproducens MBEL55E]|uniref:Uncharacterized protein n=1 Tax=Mannheimia succiniciproducens (strain KCTC 0769BP / MBEL55E) TaxID=221988 RepID=Q65R58_MANSM|nr:unknown [[Mannheimia] succiniciproducens MBEL55E]
MAGYFALTYLGKITPKLTSLFAPVTLGKLLGKLCILR